MRVKIGNKWYDPEKEPIMVELSEKDKWNIIHMLKSNKYYCVYPDTISKEDIKNWMDKK